MTPVNKIAASIRLIFAVMSLTAAGITEGFGKAILDILKKQYPGQTIDADPAQVGNKIMSISRRENQYNDERSMDAIQDYLTYLISSNWNFAKDFQRWQDALNAVYTNVRKRAITKSIQTQRQKKTTKSIDDAFGKRGEDGGSPEGGEGHMPTSDRTPYGMPADEKAAAKKFMEIIDDNIDFLRNGLPLEQRVLFDLVYDDNIGTFSSDILSNMKQASAFEEKLKNGSDEEKAIYTKNENRWSGFVGDTRKKLLESIRNFAEQEMTPAEIDIIWDEFFSRTTPKEMSRNEKSKELEKSAYQRSIDERKISRWKWQEENGVLKSEDKISFENLKKKLKKEGVNIDSIKPVEVPEGSAKPRKKKEASSHDEYDEFFAIFSA